MSDTNIVVLKGRLAKSAEMKMLQSGKPCITFTLAVGESRPNKETGEWENIPHFFEVTSFSNYAKGAMASLTKGQEVLITGRLRQDRWQKDEKTFSKVSIVSDNLEILRAPKNATQNAGTAQNAVTTPPPQFQPPQFQGQWQTQPPSNPPQFDNPASPDQYPDDPPY